MFAWPTRSGMQLSEPIVLVVSTFMFVITVIFYGLSSADNSQNFGFKLSLTEYYRGICINDTEDGKNVSYHEEGYPVQISPPMWGYTVAIIVTLIWQLAWLVYGWLLLFRPTVPKVIPMASYVLFTTALGLLIIRLYLNANGHVNPALAAQILLTASLVGSLGLAHFLMYYRTFQLQQEGLVMDKWLTRTLVHNGLALFITWEMIELMVGVNITMVYNSGKTLEPDVASSIVLFSYIVVVTIWLILETSILDQFMRYTHSIYPMFIWYFATALIEQWDHHTEKQTRNNSFLVGALGYTVTIQFCRAVFLVFFRMSRPLDWPQPRPSVAGYQRIQHLQY